MSEHTPTDQPIDQGSAELEYLPPRIDDDDLARIESVEDAVALGEQIYGQQATSVADVIGTGFVKLDDKEVDQLVGVRFYVLSWRFSAGEYGDESEFVSVQLITAKGGEKFIITDGGSGIYTQLKRITKDTGQYGHLWVDRGIRTSDYKYCERDTCRRALSKREEMNNRCAQCGSGSAVIPATTRYLDTSKVRTA